jgi:hypothetical protein
VCCERGRRDIKEREGERGGGCSQEKNGVKKREYHGVMTRASKGKGNGMVKNASSLLSLLFE